MSNQNLRDEYEKERAARLANRTPQQSDFTGQRFHTTKPKDDADAARIRAAKVADINKWFSLRFGRDASAEEIAQHLGEGGAV